MAEFNNEQMAGFIKSGLRVKPDYSNAPKRKRSGLLAISEAFKKMAEEEQQEDKKDE